jgi:hypothetical protein
MKRIIYAILSLIAFVFALGSMGAYANESIGFGQLILQVGISFLVAWYTLSHLDD